MDHHTKFRQAISLRDSGLVEEAQAILETLVKSEPQHLAYFAVLGGVYWDQGLMDEAIETFRQATLHAPRSETASLGLFHTLWESGAQHDALREAHRFLNVADSSDYLEILEEIEAHEDPESYESSAG